MSVQDAITDLIQITKRNASNQPLTVLSGLRPSRVSSVKGSNAVHPVTNQQHIDWSDSEQGSDEEEQGPPELLVVAAMFLLQYSSLAMTTDHYAEKPRSSDCLKPACNWDAFVQQQLNAKTITAAPSSKLLAMRTIVPSPSAQMVFASQVCFGTASATE